MAYRVGKRHIIGIAVIITVLLAVGLFIWALTHPYDDTRSDAPAEQPAIVQQDTPETDEASEPMADEVETPTIDPTTVSSVDIESLGITVSYLKGISGFSYSIDQTGSGTKFVDFVSDSLKGTKCTDDEGVFATIIQSADSNEDQATIALTKVVNGETYGLSLPSNTCTADTALFAQYQQSFKDAFGLLKAL